MKTILGLQKILIISLLFLVGNLWGQTTYTGIPSASGAICPTTTEYCGSTAYYGNIIKANVQTVSGNSITFRVRKCDGSSFSSSGTLKIMNNTICGTEATSITITSGGTFKDISINVSHIGTKNYRIVLLTTSIFYTNELSVTGTAPTPPSLQAETCFNINSTALVPGQTISGDITIRNTPSSQSWSGTVTVLIRRKLSPYLEQILTSQNFTIAGGNSQTINFSSPLTVTGGSYAIYCKYSNSPNGGDAFIVNNGCVTCSGLGCLSTTTPSALITVTDQPFLVCGTPTISPVNPTTGQPATFTFPISNTGLGNYPSALTFRIKIAPNGAATNLTPNTPYPGNISSGSSFTFIHSTSSIVSAAGNYLLEIADSNGMALCSQPFTIGTSSCITWKGTPPTGDKLTAANFLCSKNIIINTQTATDNASNAITRELMAKVTFKSIYMDLGTPASPAVNYPVPFTDMQNSASQWLPAIKVLSYLQFTDDETPFDRDYVNFNPSELLPRGQVIRILLEAFDIQPAPLPLTGTLPYTDVSSNPYLGYIKKAKDLGFLLPGTLFNVDSNGNPNINISREDLFVVLWKILKATNFTKPTASQLNSSTNYFVPGNNRMDTFSKVPDIDRGNFNHYQKTSFSIAGRGVSLDFTHTYNSFLTELPKGFVEQNSQSDSQKFIPLGIGWTHTYNIYAQKIAGYTYDSVIEPDKLMIYYPDGSINTFNYNTNTPIGIGVYDSMSRIPITGGERITITTKSQVKYVFENYNNGKFYFIKAIKDRNSNGVDCTWISYLTNVYRLSKVQENNAGTLGRFLTFNYNTLSPYLTSVVDNSLTPVRTITFQVDALKKNLTWFKDAKNQQTSYTYDLTGTTTTKNLLTQIQLPKGNKIQNTYFQNKLKSSKTFDINNVLSSTTNVNWAQNYSTTGYNSSASVNEPPTSAIPLGRTTNYTHNTLGNPTQIETPTGTTTFNTYDTSGNGNNQNLPTNLTINGQTSIINYDIKGNVLNITKNGIQNVFTYTNFNDVLTHKDGMLNTTTYEYDTNGNLRDVIRPTGFGSTHINRNSFFQVADVTNPSGIVTTYGYDNTTALGMLSSVTMPLGISSSTIYDGASRAKSKTDAMGKTTRFEYDENDNLKKITDANNKITTNGFDLNDNNITITNAKNEIQTNEYTFDDDTLKSETFGTHQKNYTYNSDGTIKTYTRGNGIFTYVYDAQGRVSSDGTNSYSYDPRNNVKTIVNANGTLSLNYDVNDRLENYLDYYGNTVAYTYDNNNNVKKIIYPGSKTVEYFYDAVNRCTDVKDWNLKNTHYDYLTDDRISKITLPNGTYTDYNYDAAGRPEGITNKKANGTIISQYGFTMDANGNHLTETINEPSIVTGLATITNSVITYGLSPKNRLASQGTTTFDYNTPGGITTRGTDTYNYDINDNLITASGSLTAQFQYDGSGNRRAKTVSGVNTRYVLSILGMSQELMETNASNAVQNYYVYGPTGLLYRVKANNTTYSYYHYDYRGSTTAITNEVQIVTHSYSYDPFGKVLAKTEADANPFQYVGQHGVQYESPTLTFMRARYYDPTTGRFVSEDPIKALNLYPYADNNPVMGIDPDGKVAKWVFDGLASGIIAGAFEWLDGGNAKDIAKEAAWGFAKGAVNSFVGKGASIQIISGVLNRLADQAFKDIGSYKSGKLKLSKEQVSSSVKKYFKEGVKGAVSGLINYAFGSQHKSTAIFGKTGGLKILKIRNMKHFKINIMDNAIDNMIDKMLDKMF